jgi:hypothetical protein
MGLYNRLKISVVCENCHKQFEGKLQFKIGDLRLYEYNVGDRIKAELSDKELQGKNIFAYGILENELCPFCSSDNKEEYDIAINDLNIVNYSKMSDYSFYFETDGGRYYVKK